VTEQVALRGGDSKDMHATTGVADALKPMIVFGAAQLGVSRLVVREGLLQREPERLVHHVPNAGCVIAKLSQEEFKQVYLMRHVLEAELIEVLPQSDSAKMSELDTLCTEIADAGPDPDAGAEPPIPLQICADERTRRHRQRGRADLDVGLPP
jgi:hypothetical protein